MIPTSIWQIFFAPILAAVTAVLAVELIHGVVELLRDKK